MLNNVPTWRLHRPEDRDHVLARLHEVVVKEVHGAGGYGMLVGPASTAAERDEFRARILALPDKYIAQPTLALSTCPTFVESGLAPATHRFSSLRAVGQAREPRAGRPYARRAARRLAGRELVAGRGNEGHLGRREVGASPNMLCRTANELFWMSRHIERAENAARLLDVTYKMSLLPYEVVEPGLAWAEPWAVPLVTSGLVTTLLRAVQRARGRERAAADDPRPAQSVVDLQLPAMRRASRRARCAARSPRRCTRT